MSNVLSLAPSFFLPKIKIRFGVSRGFFYLASLTLLALLLGYYIVQVNSLTRERYLLGERQEKVSLFSRANESLAVDFSKSNSLVNAEKYLSGQNFEKAKNIKYIQLLEGVVVR